MSVDIDKLQVGQVVRLASGSPKMAITGFGPANHPVRKTVLVTGWSDRIGIFRAELSPAILVFPRPQPDQAETPSDEE